MSPSINPLGAYSHLLETTLAATKKDLETLDDISLSFPVRTTSWTHLNDQKTYLSEENIQEYVSIYLEAKRTQKLASIIIQVFQETFRACTIPEDGLNAYKAMYGESPIAQNYSTLEEKVKEVRSGIYARVLNIWRLFFIQMIPAEGALNGLIYRVRTKELSLLGKAFELIRNRDYLTEEIKKRQDEPPDTLPRSYLLSSVDGEESYA